jgi:hypothetical protein
LKKYKLKNLMEFENSLTEKNNIIKRYEKNNKKIKTF